MITIATETENNVVQTLTRYGRPPDLAAHLRKLGEEVGELNEAVANFYRPASMNNPDYVDEMVGEIGDVAMVLTSMLQKIARSEVSLLELLRKKTTILEGRMHEGRYDRRHGPTNTAAGRGVHEVLGKQSTRERNDIP